MNVSELLKDPLNAEIVGLLAATKLSEVEKRLWVFALPKISEKQKLDLKGNLEKELEYEMKVEEKARNQFLTALQKGI
ncbi:MAG: hypothetical protein AAB588_02665 [Patescibacteria group bacterium]